LIHVIGIPTAKQDEEPMPTEIMIALPVLFATVIAAFAIFDYIIHLQYTRYPEAWQQEGQPGGMFRSPPNAKRENSAAIFYGRLFKTPAWARDDQQIQRLFWLWRILVAIWNIGVLSILITQFIL
jgi:hypothetical protein